MKFYTNVTYKGSKILCRYIEDGIRYNKKFDFKPELFLPSNKSTEYKSLYKQPLEKMEYENIWDMKNFIKEYKEVAKFSIYGMEDPIIQYISRKFPKEIIFDQSKIHIANIDIETTCEKGFPDIYKVDEEVTAITLYDFRNKMYTTFGCSKWGRVIIKGNDRKYLEYSSEYDLLKGFLTHWASDHPDIVTGWNINGFDIPFLYNRMRKLFGQDVANRISPWGEVREKDGKDSFDRPIKIYEIEGLSRIDYLEAYKKFGYRKHSDWKLDTIGNDVVGIRKLDLGGVKLHELYKTDYQKYIEYNIRDTEIVTKIEENKKILKLIIYLAYAAKINYEDVYSPVKTWDSIIYNYLYKDNIIVPPKKSSRSAEFPGAHVRDTIAGKHKNVVTFDFQSMYPSMMMGQNISPETIIDGKFIDFDIDANLDLDKPVNDNDNYAFCASGYYFSKEKQGIFGEVIQHFFNERKRFKGMMKEQEKLLVNDPDNKAILDLYYGYDTQQLCVKILLNSLYGAASNQWFRFFDLRLATSITLHGQFAAKFIAKKLNEYLRSVATYKHDPVIAGDTDSVMLTLDPVILKLNKKLTTAQTIDVLDKISKEQLTPRIQKWFKEFDDYCNAYQNKLVLNREVIADVSVFVAKKKYVMNIWDSEGIRYKEAKKKVRGIETVKSSTPEWAKGKLEKILDIVLLQTEKDLQEYIVKAKEEFMQLDPVKIGIPMTINGLTKYTGQDGNAIKGAGANARASINYNKYVKKLGLQNSYHLIKDGDKIKYIWMFKNSPINDNIIAFNESWPKEFKLDNYIDKQMQFEKVFLAPIENVIGCIGWRTENSNTLDELFG